MFSVIEQNWHSGFCPEYGFMVPVETVFFLFNIKYNYAFKSADAPAHTYWTLRFGVSDIW